MADASLDPELLDAYALVFARLALERLLAEENPGPALDDDKVGDFPRPNIWR